MKTQSEFDEENDILDFIEEEKDFIENDQTEIVFNDLLLEEENVEYDSLETELVVRKRKNKGKNRRWKIVIISLIVFCCVLAAYFIEENTPSTKMVDLYSYYNTEYGSDSSVVVFNYEKTDAKGVVKNDNYYLDQSFIYENITDKFYYDSTNQQVLYTTAENIYRIPLNSTEYYIDGEQMIWDKEIAIYQNDTLYLLLDFVQGKAGFTYETYTLPYRIAIVMDEMEYEQVTVENKGDIRLQPSIKSDILGEGSQEEVSWMVSETTEEMDQWTKVMTMDGRDGYIQNKYIANNTETYVYNSDYIPEVYSSQLKDYSIMLVWHAIYDVKDNSDILELLEGTDGITTVSPTWYKVIDETGTISSFADKVYVDYIHSLGMEIWPLISDFTSGEDNGGWNETTLFSTTEYRSNLINNIISESLEYNYDGINIDFEKVPSEAGADYTQFIRELSIACRKNEIVLSIDNYVPRSFNQYYNRTAQGECADYVIVMGYDEYYSGSDQAGSVASINFVEEGLDATLEQVPSEKVINALPFYTRLWMYGENEEGNLELTSKNYSMQGGLDIAYELGLSIDWNEEAQQWVGLGNSGDIYYSIWLEEEDSMAAKMEVVNQRNIGGIAAWRLGMELDNIWSILQN